MQTSECQLFQLLHAAAQLYPLQPPFPGSRLDGNFCHLYTPLELLIVTKLGHSAGKSITSDWEDACGLQYFSKDV